MVAKPISSAVMVRFGKAENPYIPLSSFWICKPDYHGYFASKNEIIFKSSYVTISSIRLKYSHITTAGGGGRRGDDLQIRQIRRDGLTTPTRGENRTRPHSPGPPL